MADKGVVSRCCRCSPCYAPCQHRFYRLACRLRRHLLSTHPSLLSCLGTMIFPLLALLIVSFPALAQVTSPQLLVGTWSSGSKNVVTGPVSVFFLILAWSRLLLTRTVAKGFAQPANTSFIYPATAGVSYSL